MVLGHGPVSEVDRGLMCRVGAVHGSMPRSWPLVTKKGPTAASGSAHTANNLTPGG